MRQCDVLTLVESCTMSTNFTFRTLSPSTVIIWQILLTWSASPPAGQLPTIYLDFLHPRSCDNWSGMVWCSVPVRAVFVNGCCIEEIPTNPPTPGRRKIVVYNKMI
ncbi:hypothetical protein RRG08_009902 [Elysia crispata]|uniref:Uncharacterized protein n=1 Tax=Elysia crispata TaxID=231223 RepID=A0AAE1CUS9_9GAST|nr:hypothetical protein RRG08_009902 [Elysia crispata]